jgi:putative selenate reductase
MPRLTPIPFPDLLRRMRREAELSEAIFDLSVRNWFLPSGKSDFSAHHFSHLVSTPVGPAAGPHTQLAQNIVLSWLAGARVLELKTVQVNDHLEIPRPCIHIPNVGYNVEWSQELPISESLREYAKALFLIQILKESSAFGAASGIALADSGETLFDVSLGYDLQGICSEKVSGFLASVRHAANLFDALRRELADEDLPFRDLPLPDAISDCVTLSTFHGCPAEQIEGMVRYLLEELRFNVIVKFNPTLLGFHETRELLIERLGYRHLQLPREAFERDLQYVEALEMMRRLCRVARDSGLGVGAKFTNTLVVANDPAFFPTQPEPYMYLSGQPLHVLAMHLMQRFREDLGFEIPISFSAGIDRRNFPAAVACGMVPVTSCTDLLRQGGYARLPRYLHSLEAEFARCGVTSREAYVLALHGHGAEAAQLALRSVRGGAQVWEQEGPRLARLAQQQPDQLPGALRAAASAAGLNAEAVVLQATRIAGRLNGRAIVPPLADDPHYFAQSTLKEPGHVSRRLGLYDCSNCDLCIHACPNDAVFVYHAEPVEAPTERIRATPGGKFSRARGGGYSLRKTHQLAVVANLCNHCSNCEVYCPEEGAPYKLKERVFSSVEGFWAAAPDEGFCRRGNVLYARLGGMEWILEPNSAANDAVVFGRNFRMEVELDPVRVREVFLHNSGGLNFDTALLWRMKTVWQSIFNSSRPNAVNPDPLFRPVAPSSDAAPAGGRR